MPARPASVLTLRRGRRARIGLVAGIGWSCLAVAGTAGASAHRPAAVGSHAHAAGRSVHPAPEPGQGEVAAPVLVEPSDHATVTATGPVTRVKLSWRLASHRQGQPSFVELVTRDGRGTHEVYAGYVHGTYLMAALPSHSARYFWRVYATSGSGTADGSAHYALSGWGGFAVASQSAQR